MANFENITIEKGMYQTNGGISGALEKLDPSENYRGTALEGLDAFSRQLKRFDIKVKGRNSDCVEKFFQSSNSAALFPEYVSRAVMQGMERADILPNLVATVTDIEGMDYRSIASVPSEDDKSLKLVGEGAKIPQTEVKTRENLVKLHKRGRMLVASYEDLLKLWTELAPYELNTILASTPEMQKILSLSQLQDSNAGLDFQATGRMITPLGASLLHTPELEGGKIIGLDKNCALEMVQAGGVVTDYDKLIDRQLERAAVTCTAGFSKIFTEASKVMSC